jgi:hypothetical protein
MKGKHVQLLVELHKNSLACEMRRRVDERMSVRQGSGKGCTLIEANLPLEA